MRGRPLAFKAGWYREPGWRASEQGERGGGAPNETLPTEADPFFMAQLQGRLA
jgi:hypothetical protein